MIRAIVFSPLALLRLILTLLLTFFWAVSGWIWLQFSDFGRKYQRRIVGNWGRSVLFCLGVVIDRNDLPSNSNYILMPNHRSYLDIFLVASLTPSAMVAKAELKKWPVMKLALKVSNSIMVDRKSSRSLLNTMKQIRESVEQNIPVALFPEGTTYKGPLTKSFKSGSFKIAAETGIPIIPMAINFSETDDAWVDDDTFVAHFFRQMGKPLTRVSIRYGESISGNDVRDLQEKTKNSIDKMLSEMI